MKRTLSKIIDYAARLAEPERIVLFGSMANGSANVFSDIDLLIVLENKNLLAKKDIATKISTYVRELSLKADLLVYSESEIENERHKPDSFIANILKSGKIVFENKKKIKNSVSNK